MGYCYSPNGGLLCDFCGATGARKYRCPFGYCNPVAACPDCRKKHAATFGRAAHRARGCERQHLRFIAEQTEKETALAAGEYVLAAGLNAPNGMVHAIFRGKDGEKGKLIPYAIYQRRTEFINCMTIARFEQLAGEPLADAPAQFPDTRRLATLTAEEDAAWTSAFQYWTNKGKDENAANALAWWAVRDAFPRLKRYDGCKAQSV